MSLAGGYLDLPSRGSVPILPPEPRASAGTVEKVVKFLDLFTFLLGPSLVSDYPIYPAISCQSPSLYSGESKLGCGTVDETL